MKKSMHVNNQITQQMPSKTKMPVMETKEQKTKQNPTQQSTHELTFFQAKELEKQEFDEMIHKAQEDKLTVLDFSKMDLTPAQLLRVHELKKQKPNVEVVFSIMDEQEKHSLEQKAVSDKRSLGNGKGLDDKLQQAKKKNKRSLGNGKGLDDKLQQKQKKNKRSLGNGKGLDDKLHYSLLDRIFIFLHPDKTDKNQK